MLDDIDRLDVQGIRQLFKPVRVVANLPSIIYLLKFDFSLAESGLSQGETQEDQEYKHLNKIEQGAEEMSSVP